MDDLSTYIIYKKPKKFTNGKRSAAGEVVDGDFEYIEYHGRFKYHG